jgi:transcriptional regulator of acetoin/glycerol metabolism
MAAAFHLQAESVGLFSEGLLAFDGDGRICAVNQSALNLLGRRARLAGQAGGSIFDCSLDELFAAPARSHASWPLRTRDGRQLFAACVARRAKWSVPAPAGQCQPLAGICLATRRCK